MGVWGILSALSHACDVEGRVGFAQDAGLAFRNTRPRRGGLSSRTRDDARLRPLPSPASRPPTCLACPSSPPFRAPPPPRRSPLFATPLPPRSRVFRPACSHPRLFATLVMAATSRASPPPERGQRRRRRRRRAARRRGALPRHPPRWAAALAMSKERSGLAALVLGVGDLRHGRRRRCMRRSWRLWSASLSCRRCGHAAAVLGDAVLSVTCRHQRMLPTLGVGPLMRHLASATSRPPGGRLGTRKLTLTPVTCWP